MIKSVIFVALLLTMLSSTTYAITSSDDYIQCVTEKILENCISVPEVQNLANESIFNFLKDFENKLPKGNILFDKRQVLVCEIPNDFKTVVRYDANKYSFYYFPSQEDLIISCPKIQYITNITIKIVLSLFSVSFALYFGWKFWKRRKRRKVGSS